MSAYTDADVQAAALAAFSFEQCDRRQKLDVQGNWDGRLNEQNRQEYRNLVRVVLDAVAPAIAARALREHADELIAAVAQFPETSWERHNNEATADLARRRADEIEAGR